MTKPYEKLGVTFDFRDGVRMELRIPRSDEVPALIHLFDQTNSSQASAMAAQVNEQEVRALAPIVLLFLSNLAEWAGLTPRDFKWDEFFASLSRFAPAYDETSRKAFAARQTEALKDFAEVVAEKLNGWRYLKGARRVLTETVE